MSIKEDMGLQILSDLTKIQLLPQKWTLMPDFSSTNLFPKVGLLDGKL